MSQSDQDTLYITKYNKIVAQNYTDSMFKKTIVTAKDGVRRYDSIVTVPMKRNLCGVPTNLTGIYESSNSILLSWSPPNTGSCNITSYTIFWCHFGVKTKDCSPHVSDSR